MFTHFPEWGWNKLPKQYLENEYLSADSEALHHISLDSDSPLETLENSLEEKSAFQELPEHYVSKNYIIMKQ